MPFDKTIWDPGEKPLVLGGIFFKGGCSSSDGELSPTSDGSTMVEVNTESEIWYEHTRRNNSDFQLEYLLIL